MSKKWIFLVVLLLATLAAYGIFHDPVDHFVGAITGEEIAITVIAFIGFWIVVACVMSDKVGGVFATILVAAWLIYGVVDNAHAPHPYRSYKATVVTVQQPQTMQQLCTSLRPTWKQDDCVTQIKSQNRALSLKLDAGDKVFIDKSMSDGGEIDYKKTAVKVGFGQKFATVQAACDKLRPTWKVPSCTNRVLQKNPQLLAHANWWIITIPSDIS